MTTPPTAMDRIPQVAYQQYLRGIAEGLMRAEHALRTHHESDHDRLCRDEMATRLEEIITGLADYYAAQVADEDDDDECGAC